jgi:multicomponent Na+:H+ antiporter subunit D
VRADSALFVLGALSVIYGAVQAVGRREIAEVLAYSSVGQVGYILIALALAPKIGYSAVILFATINAMNKAVLFLGEQLRGPFSGAIFFIGACSVAGLPPVAGFFGKAGLIQAALDDDHPLLVVLIVLGSGLSFIYMFQPFLRVFWGQGDLEHEHVSPLDRRLLVVGLALVVLAAGIWPQPLLAVSDHAAAVLEGGR